MRIITILIILFIFNSCGDRVSFEMPQPEGVANEERIPKKLIGIYFGIEDSCYLRISSDKIIKTKDMLFKGLVSELDSADKVNYKRDTVYSELGLQSVVKIKGDSITQEVHYIDTLFQSNNRNNQYTLRKFKGHYFISIERVPNHWSVYQLEKTKRGVTLFSIMSKNGLDKLQHATEAISDSVTHFKPTKKQFKKFIKDNGFGHDQHYLKLID